MSESIHKYQQLTVWQKGMQLVKLIYLVTKALPHEELYGLSNQMRRAVISIPSNIAEGFGRYNTKEYMHFLRIARGSCYEVETQLQICTQINYLTEEETSAPLQLCNEINRMLNAMLTKLSKKQSPSS